MPGAEYDRDPHKIEQQARLVACAPKLMKLVRDLANMVGESTEEASPEMLRLGKAANTLLRHITEQPVAPDVQAVAAE